MARFSDREERERYLDSIERQMEHQREEIQRTLDRTTEGAGGRRRALEKLRSAIPSFSKRSSVRGVEQRETPSTREESPRELSEPRSWWRRLWET